jgi:hypothetical protein
MQVEIQLPKTRVKEGDGFTATAYFRTRSTKAASTPTTIRYRIDCLKTGQKVTDWTSVSAASNISIAIPNAQIISDVNTVERKQIIVQADAGLSTQSTGRAIYQVENIYGIS